MDQGELMRRAFAAYCRSETLAGSMVTLPRSSTAVQVVDGKQYVVLRSLERVLAVYRVRKGGEVRRVERWPGEFDQSEVEARQEL